MKYLKTSYQAEECSIQVVKGVIYKEPGERGLAVKHPSPACKRDANYSYRGEYPTLCCVWLTV